MMGVSNPEIARITKRRDFIAVKHYARAKKTLSHGRAFVLQGAPRDVQGAPLEVQMDSKSEQASIDPSLSKSTGLSKNTGLSQNTGLSKNTHLKKSDALTNRFGFTVTKRVGNSVVRNRIRRRMREAVRLHARDILQKNALTNHDFVLIARHQALHIPFGQIIDDLTSGLDHIAKKSTKQHRAIKNTKTQQDNH